MLQLLSVIAPLGTLTVAVLSATFAFLAIKAQRRNMRQQVARNLFADYIKKSVDYPHFASPEISRLVTETKMDLISIKFVTMEEFQNAHPEIERYEWFVSLLVFSINEILSMKPHKKRESYWRALALRHLGYHRPYFLWRLEIEKTKLNSIQESNIWFLQLGGEFQKVMKQVLAPHLDQWKPRPYSTG